MRHKTRPVPTKFSHNIHSAPASEQNELIELFTIANWQGLELKARIMAESYPTTLLAWKALGKALLMQGNLSEAITPLSQALKLAPVDADIHNDLGHIFESLNRSEEAEASYRSSLKHNPKFAEAHNNLAILLMNQSRLTEAEEHCRKALKINPNSANSHNNLGCIHRDLGQLNQALSCFQKALEINPNYFDAWFNLGVTQQNLELMDEAQNSYLKAIALNPNAEMPLQALGSLLSNVDGKNDVATYCLNRAFELNPNNADTCIALGNLLIHTDQTDKGWTMFRRAKELRPLATRPAKKAKADFSVLLLDSPIAGSTPLDYLLSNAVYNSNFYCLIEDDPQNFDFLRANGDVVINLISDADNGKDLFPFVIDIADRIKRPIVNHPRLIMNTDRESMSKLIDSIPLCKAPKTKLFKGTTLLEYATNNNLAELTMPVLVRLAGGHGGDDCDKFTDCTSIINFVSQRPELNYYVSEYADYQSVDGFFRKYRLIYVNGELLPYHLAIHNEWLVHYFRTDMSNQEWMRKEEEAFLNNPELVFSQAQQIALKSLAISTGLDYFGIDCSIDKNENVLIFEANATMRVHSEKNEIFAYKNPYIHKIKEAFDLMLARLAASI
ncbi:tetratricopeptide repeat protein [Methylomonas sp. AM2-LC]|uniref:tetratricopeptide repeat protein n=1 Tax=Methylomonas sp. AM2-LC TaxID=3153301 RepID=UPI003265E714